MEPQSPRCDPTTYLINDAPTACRRHHDGIALFLGARPPSTGTLSEIIAPQLVRASRYAAMETAGLDDRYTNLTPIACAALTRRHPAAAAQEPGLPGQLRYLREQTLSYHHRSQSFELFQEQQIRRHMAPSNIDRRSAVTLWFRDSLYRASGARLASVECVFSRFFNALIQAKKLVAQRRTIPYLVETTYHRERLVPATRASASSAFTPPQGTSQNHDHPTHQLH